MLLNSVDKMKLNKTQIVEIILTVLTLLSGLILIAGFPPYSYILVITSSLLSSIWLFKSISKSEFGSIPWYAIIFILPMLIIPLGLALKLSIIKGGPLLLFFGISLSLVAIAAIFILVLTVKKH